MLYDANTPIDLPAKILESAHPNNPEESEIIDTAATSDQKWLFVAFNKGWWAQLDLELENVSSVKVLYIPGLWRPVQVVRQFL